ncbi:outer membrane beta-barrel protein [Helicobacter sp. MIT 05-5293]|uniref:outer membrane beta-barrel protein n=1 Tax=Helicobacter sp. MIT 05-5293 TaxID=1548149 RepID=UPI00068CB2E3|nr:outer membrane beta-barrel protein [Helicobacter sp. MIT 05-5293]TLD79813.1 outer membrane beta-barrel protein [Helicobacter sp. MIT 05-5293]
MGKKIVASVALSVSLLGVASAQSSGVFIGINAGVSLTQPTYSGAFETMQDALSQKGIGWVNGVDLGYKKAMNEKWGLRYYLSYNYSQSYGLKESSVNPNITETDTDIVQQLITANVDLWFHFTRSFGAYVGIGAGYQRFKPSWTITTTGQKTTFGDLNKGGLAVPLNVGLTWNFNNAHQILYGVKIPLISYDYEINVPSQQGGAGTAGLRAYIMSIGYNYTF